MIHIEYCDRLFITIGQTERNFNDLSYICLRDRLTTASLGIMGSQLKAPFKPLEHHFRMVPKGFKGGPHLGPHSAMSRAAAVTISSLDYGHTYLLKQGKLFIISTTC